MSDSESEERALQIARLEVKLDSVLEHLRQDRERMGERFEDHEQRLRYREELGDPKELVNNFNNRLDSLEKRVTKTERWTQAIPVGVAIALIVAVGALVSYVNGITP